MSVERRRVLYLSYDGMTDPLGQSQVLPYIIGLSKQGYEFTLISFEKEERFNKNKLIIQQICDTHSIQWYPLTFHTSPPLLSKAYDNYQMKSLADRLHKERAFHLIHCRSYISAGVGEYLKKKYNTKFLFDMRGFWVDERVEGNIWPQTNPLYRFFYRWYKRKEASLIHHADYIISLTEAGKDEISKWKSYQGNPIKVIPCCADFDHFSLISKEEMVAAKIQRGLSEDTLVVTYLGSIGTWYLLDEMLDFFTHVLKVHPKAIFQFITPDPKEWILSKTMERNIAESSVVVQFAQRKDLRAVISITDIGLMFIKETYSKIASSPTKLGELLAMGIPVVCNAKVGDVKSILETNQGGYALDSMSESSYKKVVDNLNSLIHLNREQIRNNAFPYYDLAAGVEKYRSVYKELLHE